MKDDELITTTDRFWIRPLTILNEIQVKIESFIITKDLDSSYLSVA